MNARLYPVDIRFFSSLSARFFPYLPWLPMLANIFCRTALHEASREGHLECVKILLEHGANPNVSDPSGVTPLHQSAFRGHFEITAALVNAKADVNATDYTGGTPLHEAAKKNRKDLIPILLHAGASLSARNKQRRTPLEIATDRDVKQMLKGMKYNIMRGHNRGPMQ
jgi:ankyrin repeat protein